MNKISVKSIAWLAGILEGEGCFQLSGEGKSPKITLEMTDEDVVAKVSKMFKQKYNFTPSKDGYKSKYRVVICGSKAVEWMFTLYSLMGNRRQSKILELIKGWKTIPIIDKDMFKCGHLKISSNVHYNGKYITCATCNNDRVKKLYWLRKSNAS